jgi:hypothetical protein
VKTAADHSLTTVAVSLAITEQLVQPGEGIVAGFLVDVSADLSSACESGSVVAYAPSRRCPAAT